MATLAGKFITENGLGLMGLTKHNVPYSDELAFKVMKTALSCGANVWDGADFYGTEENNSLHLINRYFTKYPEDANKVVLCIKSGLVSMGSFQMDCSPENMRKMVDKCNRILDGKKSIDLFGCARVDPNVPIETTVQALDGLVKEGKIGGIQLSEVRADTIKRAAKIAKVDMVEAELSLWATEIFTNGVAQVCGELGITIVAHTPLGGGMLTGRFRKPEDLPPTDHRRFFPRFQGENFQQNLALVKELEKLAATKGCTTAGLALSWIKSHNGKAGMPFIIPIAGSRSETRVQENCKSIELTEKDLIEIKAILDSFPIAGNRYPGAGAKLAEY